MRTLKFAWIETILSYAMISYAGNKQSPRVKKILRITLTQALTEPKLAKAMYAQLNISFLRLEQPGFYSATVKHTGIVYKIEGTRNEWVRFFVNKPA